MKVIELIELLNDLAEEYEQFEVVLGDNYRTYKVVGLGESSIAERQLAIEIERTGGKDE